MRTFMRWPTTDTEKNHLSELIGENGPVYTTQEMLGVATTYHKTYFVLKINIIFVLVLPSGTIMSWLLKKRTIICKKTFLRRGLRRRFLGLMPTVLQARMGYLSVLSDFLGSY